MINYTDEMKQIQRNKIRNEYKAMDNLAFNALKKDILSCFDSDDMRYYLNEHFLELNSSDLIEIIVGALKPIDFKLRVMQTLANWFPCPFGEVDLDYDFEPYVKLYEKGIDEMQAGEDSLFLLNRYSYEEDDDNALQLAVPFFSFDAAIKYIKEKTDEWLYEWTELEDALTWFKIEKWVGSDTPSLTATYTVSKYGEIWDYCECNDSFHLFGVYNAMHLNTPVPFKSGDVIIIDCMPFAPVVHSVIVRIGDNRDCCCVQCMYLNKDGTLGIGALKHASVFDDTTPMVSPLYKAKKITAGLSEDEHYMLEVGKIIAEMQEQECRNECYWDYYDTVFNNFLQLISDGCTPKNIVEKMIH